MNGSYGIGFISMVTSLNITRQPGNHFEQGQYPFQVSREHSSRLILLPQVSTEIRLQGQETKERGEFFTCIFWLTLKTKFLMFFLSAAVFPILFTSAWLFIQIENVCWVLFPL